MGRSGSVRIGSLGDSLMMRKPSKEVYVLVIFDLGSMRNTGRSRHTRVFGVEPKGHGI